MEYCSDEAVSQLEEDNRTLKREIDYLNARMSVPFATPLAGSPAAAGSLLSPNARPMEVGLFFILFLGGS